MNTASDGVRLDAWTERLARHRMVLLAVIVVLSYLPSLGGGYLPYDDDWLIERNRLLEAPLRDALGAFFFDLSRETRTTLGAEYLPLRDLSHWLEVASFGKSAWGMRLVQLGLYLGALSLLHDALARCLTRGAAFIAVALFAVHPTHVESVAWLAGRKDVLSMFFVCAALALYSRQGNTRWWAVPLVVAAALSKSMSVVCPGLLLAMDLLCNRRPAWRVLAGCVIGVVGVFALHLSVGSRVGMVGGPLAESRWVAWWTMGEVWLRYVNAWIWPPGLSIIYDVAPVRHATLASIAGWLLVLGSSTYGVFRAKAGQPFALGVAMWAWVPLLPVSHVIFPLQNVMADRYLWLSTLAPALWLGRAWSGLPRAGVRRGLALNVFRGGLVGLLCWFIGGAASRAALFGDPVALFADATRKSTGPRAPYQWGYTSSRVGDVDVAIAGYEEALRRDCFDCGAQRSAANNLAQLFVRRGQPQLAEPVLRRSLERFPDDPKTVLNLVKVLTRLGRVEEARQLYETAQARSAALGVPFEVTE